MKWKGSFYFIQKLFINETFENVTFSYGCHFLFECLTHKNGLKRESVDTKNDSSYHKVTRS